jgi:hypothetical protein
VGNLCQEAAKDNQTLQSPQIVSAPPCRLTETSPAYMRGGSSYSPNASCWFSQTSRLSLRIGRTFEPTHSGTGSFARSRHAHASGERFPLIRALLEPLYHGEPPRLRTFPDGPGDRGDNLLWFKVGKAGRPNTNRVVLARIHMNSCASAAISVSSHTAHSNGSTVTVWSGKQKLR